MGSVVGDEMDMHFSFEIRGTMIPCVHENLPET